jgi:hypothetical protein
MIIGAKADSADGRLQDQPAVGVQVSDAIPASAGNGKVCCVIHTAESDVAPHFVNGRKGVWVRSNEFMVVRSWLTAGGA